MTRIIDIQEKRNRLPDDIVWTLLVRNGQQALISVSCPSILHIVIHCQQFEQIQELKAIAENAARTNAAALLDGKTITLYPAEAKGRIVRQRDPGGKGGDRLNRKK